MPGYIVGDCRVECDKRAGNSNQLLILGIGIGGNVRTFQLDPNREIVAPFAPVIHRYPGMPGALIKRNILNHLTITANQAVSRHAQMRNLSEEGMSIGIYRSRK